MGRFQINQENPEGIRFRSMSVDDIGAVHEIETQSFPTPWSQQAFYQELTNNTVAQYLIAEKGDRLVGYAGMWVMLDEAHVTNIAVRSELRGQKIGEQLLHRLIAVAVRLGAKRMTLEVRKSNEVAQNLYQKFGFRAAGVRKKYYSDKEDAILMWADLPERAEDDGWIE